MRTIFKNEHIKVDLEEIDNGEYKIIFVVDKDYMGETGIDIFLNNTIADFIDAMVTQELRATGVI